MQTPSDRMHSATRSRAAAARGQQDGFTLVEALVTLFLLTLIALSVGQLVGVGLMSNEAAEHLTVATTLSNSKIEQLRNTDYVELIAGGSLDSDQATYFDFVDDNDDGANDYSRRWQITDQVGGKLVAVQVVALPPVLGPAKSTTLATVIAER